MKNKVNVFAGMIPFLLLVAIIFFGLENPGHEITIRGDHGTKEIMVELAHTPEDREMGLMFRQELEDDRGMLFIYDEPHRPAFWMKNMNINLDILFINSEREITQIEEYVPPCNEENDRNCPLYIPKEKINYVLELPAGYVEEEDIEVGNEVEIPLFERP